MWIKLWRLRVTTFILPVNHDVLPSLKSNDRCLTRSRSPRPLTPLVIPSREVRWSSLTRRVYNCNEDCAYVNGFHFWLWNLIMLNTGIQMTICCLGRRINFRFMDVCGVNPEWLGHLDTSTWGGGWKLRWFMVSATGRGWGVHSVPRLVIIT